MKVGLLFEILLVGSLLALTVPVNSLHGGNVILNPLNPALAAQPAILSAPNATLSVQPNATIDLARSMQQMTVELALNNTPDVPPFNAVTLTLSYDPHVLTASSLDYSTNVFTQTSYPTVVLRDCLEGHGANGVSGLCGSDDGPGITSFAESILGGQTPDGTQGNIFFLTFNVNTTAPSFSQIQIKQAILGYGSTPIPLTLRNGYYSSLSCGAQACSQPIANFIWSPHPAKQGQVTIFNGGSSLPSSGASITDFFWSFGDTNGARPYLDTGTNSSAQYVYAVSGNYSVTLAITDSRGLHASKIQLVIVINALSIGDFRIAANPLSLTIRKANINDQFAAAVSTIILASINGFSGNVSLTASPTGFLGETFIPSQVSLAANSSANSRLVLSAAASPLGTYFVTVTGTSGSVSHSVTLSVQVVVQPDFQLILSISNGGNVVFPGGATSVGVLLFSNGLTVFNGTVTLTGQVSPLVSDGPTLSFNPTQISFAPSSTPFSQLTISTTVTTPPGNYTITVRAISGTLVHTFQLQLTVLPPPVLTLSPSSGPVGTQVRVHGSGFLSSSQGRGFSPVELQITFDDQFLGFFFLQGSSFNFTFDVPNAQTGISHQIHAKELFPSSLDVQASFLVLPEPVDLTLGVSGGTIYFPGDTATFFAMTSLSGQPTTVTSLQVILVRPDGSKLTLNAVLVSPGVYKTSYVVPATGSIGTYAVLVKAHQAGSSDRSALVSFEVKPTWLQSNSRNIITATSLVGAVGALGVVGLAWRKGYFNRRKDEFLTP